MLRKDGLMNFFGSMTKLEAVNVSPLVLAYVGDAVHSLIVREQLVHQHDFKAGRMHQLASSQVNAHSQSEMAERLLPLLTEEEHDVFMRGRNAKNHHVAKNQTLADYRMATGMEAVIGYLYLIGESDRIIQLFGELQ